MMRMMTRSFTTAAAIYGVATSAAHAQATARPNFSGTWVLDLAKSQGSTRLPLAATWTITQHGDTLIADRETTVDQVGTIKSHILVGLDGKSWKNTVPQPGIGDVETATVATWDKSVLVFTLTGNIQETDFVQTDRWTLSADGKSLESQRSVTVEGQEVQSATFAFTKKS
jgi:hypothetical protein